MIHLYMTGNLTRNPETRTTKSGKTCCKFTIACDGRGAYKQEGDVVYITVVTFENLARACQEWLLKGMKVSVHGREPNLHPYLGKDGTPKATIEFVADEVEFMTKRSAEVRNEERMEAQREAAAAMVDAPVEYEDEGFVPVSEELPFEL